MHRLRRVRGRVSQDAITWTEMGERNGPGSLDWNRCERCGISADACFADARERMGREMTVDTGVSRDRPRRRILRRVGRRRDADGWRAAGAAPVQPGAPGCVQGAGDPHRAGHLRVCSWNVLDQVRPYVDLFLYDLKLVDDARHREVTGAPVGPILANLRALSDAATPSASACR